MREVSNLDPESLLCRNQSNNNTFGLFVVWFGVTTRIIEQKKNSFWLRGMQEWKWKNIANIKVNTSLINLYSVH